MSEAHRAHHPPPLPVAISKLPADSGCRGNVSPTGYPTLPDFRTSQSVRSTPTFPHAPNRIFNPPQFNPPPQPSPLLVQAEGTWCHRVMHGSVGPDVEGAGGRCEGLGDSPFEGGENGV